MSIDTLNQRTSAAEQAAANVPHIDDLIAARRTAAAPTSFNLAPFPKVIRDLAPHVAKATETEPEATAFYALACIAAAMQRKAFLQVGPSWAEPLCLYTALVMETGEGKSPLVNMLSRAFYRREQKMRSQWAELINTMKQDAAAHGEKRPEPPPQPRLITRNFTVEKLASLMQENQQAMAVITAEGGFFEILGGRYSGAGMTADIDLLLSAWSGEPYHPDRKGNIPNAEPMYNPRLTIACAVQPVTFETLKNKGALEDRGLFARFLIIRPTSRIGHRQYKTYFVPEDVLTPWDSLLEALMDTEGETAIPVHPTAFERVQQWARATEPRLLGDLAHIKDVIGKGRANILRIAGLLLVADNLTERIGARPLTIEYIERAITIYEYALGHIITQRSELSEEGQIARWLERTQDWIVRNAEKLQAKHGCIRFGFGEVVAGKNARTPGDRAILKQALEVLEEQDIIMRSESQAKTKATALVYVVTNIDSITPRVTQQELPLGATFTPQGATAITAITAITSEPHQNAPNPPNAIYSDTTAIDSDTTAIGQSMPLIEQAAPATTPAERAERAELIDDDRRNLIDDQINAGKIGAAYETAQQLADGGQRAREIADQHPEAVAHFPGTPHYRQPTAEQAAPAEGAHLFDDIPQIAPRPRPLVVTRPLPPEYTQAEMIRRALEPLGYAVKNTGETYRAFAPDGSLSDAPQAATNAATRLQAYLWCQAHYNALTAEERAQLEEQAAAVAAD